MMYETKDSTRYDTESLIMEKHILTYLRKGESIDFMKDLNRLVFINKIDDKRLLSDKYYDYFRWVLENGYLISIFTERLHEGFKTVITSEPLFKIKDSLKK